jgi:DNA-directed RNA polymerase specialized sigma24 family protein
VTRSATIAWDLVNRCAVSMRLAFAEVRRAVERLPPDQRTALLLVTVDGLSYREAAEVVQVPVGTIMSRLKRARIALQQQIEAGRGVLGSGNNPIADEDIRQSMSLDEA